LTEQLAPEKVRDSQFFALQVAPIFSVLREKEKRICFSVLGVFDYENEILLVISCLQAFLEGST
jgi:hypothetical protein